MHICVCGVNMRVYVEEGPEASCSQYFEAQVAKLSFKVLFSPGLGLIMCPDSRPLNLDIHFLWNTLSFQYITLNGYRQTSQSAYVTDFVRESNDSAHIIYIETD